MTNPDNHAQRVLDLAQTLLKASQALEASRWQDCEKAAYNAARQARMLRLEELQAAREKELESE